MKISRHTPRHQLLEPAYISSLTENNWRMMMFKSCKEFKAEWSKHYSCARQNWNSPICSQPKNTPKSKHQAVTAKYFLLRSRKFTIQKLKRIMKKWSTAYQNYQNSLSKLIYHFAMNPYSLDVIRKKKHILNLKRQVTVYQKHVSAK